MLLQPQKKKSSSKTGVKAFEFIPLRAKNIKQVLYYLKNITMTKPNRILRHLTMFMTENSEPNGIHLNQEWREGFFSLTAALTHCRR